MKNLLLLFTFLAITTLAASAQQNTASMSGRVTDDGEGMVGATVIVTHMPTGTEYATIARPDGSFTLPGLRVGGPYYIEVSMIGYRTEYFEDLYLSIGEQWNHRFELDQSAIEMEGVVVTAPARQDKVINSSRTGASDIISQQQLETLPVMTRSVQEFTRLIPQANGNSFAGQASSTNNYSVNGVPFNEGYDAGWLGSGSGAQPISLDAIEQIQVVLAPYDVRQGGFLGANVNSVIKSGSNNFKGSAYTYIKSPKWEGLKSGNMRYAENVFSYNQYGASVSGPIMKNKLFFFANFEIDRRDSPGPRWVANDASNSVGSPDVSNAPAAELDKLSQFLLDKFNYKTGPYQGYQYKQNGFRMTANIDYNVSRRSTLNVMYSMLRSFKDQVISSSNGSSATLLERPFNANRQPGEWSLPFYNSFYIMNNDYYAGFAELNTLFNERWSNNLQFGYTAQRYYRGQMGGDDNMPLVEIGYGADDRGHVMTAFGAEPFTLGNEKTIDTFSLIDNLTHYAGRHELTFGAQLSLTLLKNGFSEFYQSVYRFDTPEDFYESVNNGTSTASFFGMRYSAQSSKFPYGYIKTSENALYVQDRINISDNFKLTLGLRGELIVPFNKLMKNENVKDLVFRDGLTGVDVSTLFDPIVSVMPRVGFNWDVLGDKTLQLRGGIGLFAGEPIAQNIALQASNNGVMWGIIQELATTGAVNRPFNRDPDHYRPESGEAVSTYDLQFVDKKFRYPQLLKMSLGADYKLGNGYILTVEGQYAKNYNAIVTHNVDLGEGGTALKGADNRIVLDTPRLHGSANPTAADPYLLSAGMLTNVNKGHSWYTTFQLQKTARDYYFSVAYALGGGKTPGSWNSQLVGDPNSSELGFNTNALAGRIIAHGSYKITYANSQTTSIGLVFDWRTGSRSSITYRGDLNNDGEANDLIYVPKSKDEIVLEPVNASDTRTPDQLWAQLDAFISSHPYLNGRRGQYAERGGARNPGNFTLDGNISHEFFIKTRSGKKNGLRVELSIQNLHNLINKNWGIAMSMANPNIEFKRIEKDGPNAGKPVFTLPWATANTMTPQVYRKYESYGNNRWAMQLGIRYTFN